MNVENEDKDYRDDTIPEEKLTYPVVRTKANSPYCSLKNRASVERVKYEDRSNIEKSPTHSKPISSLAFIKPAKNVDSCLNNKLCSTDVKPTRIENKYDYQSSRLNDDRVSSSGYLTSNNERSILFEEKKREFHKTNYTATK